MNSPPPGTAGVFKHEYTPQEGKAKGRIWTFDFYPSFVENRNLDCSVEEYLKELASDGACFAVAKHDKDEAKLHYHAIVAYSGPVPRSQVASKYCYLLDNRINARNLQIVSTFSGMCRYMLHLDDKDKAQYDESCLMTFGGFKPDYTPAVGDKCKDRDYQKVWDMMRTHQPRQWSDLIDMLFDQKEFGAVQVATRNCFALRTYIEEKGF